jgi:hypothetical protein
VAERREHVGPQRRLGDQHARVDVVEHEADARSRVIGLDRHERGAELEHGQQRRDPLGTLLETHGEQRLALAGGIEPRTATKPTGESVGVLVELAIAPGAAAMRERDRVRRRGNAAGEGLDDGRRGGIMGQVCGR